MTAHPVIRVLHDLGLATWFGGSLMGATGLNAAASLVDDPAQRARVSTSGWSRWAPVGGAGTLAHVVGAVGLTLIDSPRIAGQHGVARSSAVKGAVTLAGLGVAAWSAKLNRAMAAAGDVPVAGATDPGPATPSSVEAVQRQLKLVQWLNPLLAGAVLAAGSWQSEQQRSAQVAQGVAQRVAGQLPSVLPVAAGLGGAALLLARRRRGRQPVGQPYPVVQRPLPGSAVPDLSAAPRPDTGPTAP